MGQQHLEQVAASSMEGTSSLPPMASSKFKRSMSWCRRRQTISPECSKSEWQPGFLPSREGFKQLPRGSPSPGNHHHHHHHLLYRPWLVLMALFVVLLTLLPLVAVVAAVAVDSMSRCPSFPSNSGGSQSFRLGFCSLTCGSCIEATMAHSMRWLQESWSRWVLAVRKQKKLDTEFEFGQGADHSSYALSPFRCCQFLGNCVWWKSGVLLHSGR